MNASDQILSQLALKDGQLASSLAKAIGLDRTEVNRILYGALKGRVRQDQSYKWLLVSSSKAVPGKPSTKTGRFQPSSGGRFGPRRGGRFQPTRPAAFSRFLQRGKCGCGNYDGRTLDEVKRKG